MDYVFIIFTYMILRQLAPWTLTEVTLDSKASLKNRTRAMGSINL